MKTIVLIIMSLVLIFLSACEKPPDEVMDIIKQVPIPESYANMFYWGTDDADWRIELYQTDNETRYLISRRLWWSKYDRGVYGIGFSFDLASTTGQSYDFSLRELKEQKESLYWKFMGH